MNQCTYKSYHFTHGDLLIGKEESVEIVESPEDFVEASGHLTIFLRRKEVHKR